MFTKIYYVLFPKILQGADAASGTILQKRFSRICGKNSRLIHV